MAKNVERFLSWRPTPIAAASPPGYGMHEKASTRDCSDEHGWAGQARLSGDFVFIHVLSDIVAPFAARKVKRSLPIIPLLGVSRGSVAERVCAAPSQGRTSVLDDERDLAHGIHSSMGSEKRLFPGNTK
jgi:hypothetical protein